MNKNILLIALVSFFVDFSTAMITPILPIFVIEYLDAGYAELGIIIAVSTFVTYATRLFSGYLSDKFALVKPLVVGGYLLSTIAKPLFYFVGSWSGAAVLQTLERFGKGVREAPRDTLISYSSHAGGSGRSFGLHRTLDTAGHFFGSLTLFLALLYFGQSEETIRNLFLFSALPGLIGVMVVIVFVKDIRPKRFEIQKISFTERDRKLIWPIVIYSGFTAFLFTEPFFVMRAKESGFETLHIPLLFMVFTLSQALLSYPIGKLIDKYKSNRVLTAAYIIGVTTTLLMLYGSTVSIVLAYIGFGLYTTASLNAIRALISDIATNKALTYGFFYTVLALAIFVSSILIGLIWDSFGADNALLFSLIGTILFLILTIWKRQITGDATSEGI
ncbi:MAG: MFS transporter [Campylobacterota bacterium]|nr:MFS transporter [Campylobacterota bacterium]